MISFILLQYSTCIRTHTHTGTSIRARCDDHMCVTAHCCETPTLNKEKKNLVFMRHPVIIIFFFFILNNSKLHLKKKDLFLIIRQD